jgi:uncharacterized membrane protein
MTAKTPWRLVWILLGIVAVVAVVAVAYAWGVNSSQNGIGPFMGPRRDFGMMGWSGVGWWGVIPGLIVVFLVIFLFAALLTGPDRSSSRAGVTSPTPQAGDVDRLRELSDLHERGRLTDEEFAAAKKKILGL